MSDEVTLAQTKTSALIAMLVNALVARRSWAPENQDERLATYNAIAAELNRRIRIPG